MTHEFNDFDCIPFLPRDPSLLLHPSPAIHLLHPALSPPPSLLFPPFWLGMVKSGAVQVLTSQQDGHELVPQGGIHLGLYPSASNINLGPSLQTRSQTFWLCHLCTNKPGSTGIPKLQAQMIHRDSMAPHQGHHSVPSPKISPCSERRARSGRNSLPRCLALIHHPIHPAGLDEKFMALWLPEIEYWVPVGLSGKASIFKKQQHLLQEFHCSWHLAAYRKDQAESNGHLC